MSRPLPSLTPRLAELERCPQRRRAVASRTSAWSTRLPRLPTHWTPSKVGFAVLRLRLIACQRRAPGTACSRRYRRRCWQRAHATLRQAVVRHIAMHSARFVDTWDHCMPAAPGEDILRASIEDYLAPGRTRSMGRQYGAPCLELPPERHAHLSPWPGI